MATTFETIQQIRSLRKENRNPRLSATVLKSIEAIKLAIRSGTDQNGWKKVDWRSSSSRPSESSRPSSYATSSSSSSSSSPWSGSSRSSESSRPSSSNHQRSSNPFHQRNNKPNYTPREPPAAIPLTYATATTSNASLSPSDVDQGFEVVRNTRGGRRGPSSFESSSSAPVEFRAPPQKYVSKFKRQTDKVEDTILNTILLGKLNKFSASNYDEIKEFIMQIIDSGQTDMITCFMKLLFEKAASEEIFCPLYAKLLSELSAQYPVLLQEMAGLYSHYMNIFVEVSDEPDKNHQEFCQRNVEKKYRRGYSQFLAELIKHNVIDTDIFVMTILKIVEQIELNRCNPNAIKLVEEYADCLVRIMKAIQAEMMRSDSDQKENEDSEKISRIRLTLKENVAVRIQPLTVRSSDSSGISNKARFTFMDIHDGIQKY
jgi:hypothetical protein